MKYDQGHIFFVVHVKQGFCEVFFFFKFADDYTNVQYTGQMGKCILQEEKGERALVTVFLCAV